LSILLCHSDWLALIWLRDRSNRLRLCASRQGKDGLIADKRIQVVAQIPITKLFAHVLGAVERSTALGIEWQYAGNSRQIIPTVHPRQPSQVSDVPD